MRVGDVGEPEPALEQAASAPTPTSPRNPRRSIASNLAGAATGKTYAARPQSPPRQAGAREAEALNCSAAEQPGSTVEAMSAERASLDSQESTEGPRHPWWTVLRRIGSPAIRLLIVAAVVEFALLPQVAGAREAIHKLSGISPFWLATGLVSQILSLLAYARLTQVSLDAPGVRYTQLLRVDLATLAVSHTVPAGSAVGIGLGYRLLTRSGVSSERAVTGKALQTVGSAVVLNLMLGGALIAALVTHGNNPLYAPVAAVGLALILAATVGAALVARSEGWLTRTVVRTLEHLPKIDAESGARLIASLADTVRRLVGDRRFLIRIVLWATVNWLFEAFALWCCVRAFGHTLGPVGLLVAYGLANVAAAIPLTPGGLGIVEGILVPTLVAFSTTKAAALLGVIAFRLISFWLPIPIGFTSYARLEWQLRHQQADSPEVSDASDSSPPEPDPDLPEMISEASVGSQAGEDHS
jgi:uncharacterized protein (TIRG00374 family)